MPDFYIALQETEHRAPAGLEGGGSTLKSYDVIPMLLPDVEALAQLPDGEYHLLKVEIDEENKIKSSSVVRKRKKVKTPTPTSKVSDV
jgi:hypothetical protein